MIEWVVRSNTARLGFLDYDFFCVSQMGDFVDVIGRLCLCFQETYPHTAPIWFAESEDGGVSTAIQKVCDTTPENFNVSIQSHTLRPTSK